MENKLAVHARSCAAKAGRRFLVLLLACAESTTPGESAESTPAGDTMIFGTYRQVSTKEFTGRANGEEGETGSGYIRGTFWGEPIGATIELTKISDWSKEG